MRPGQTFRHFDRSGCFQMALDRVLTNSPPATPILRFYTWSPWTLSLGFHQQADEALLQRAEQAEVPLVRRDTGGRAVYHAEELTYSFIVAASDPLSGGRIMPLYQRINKALLLGLQELGLGSELSNSPVDLRRHYRGQHSSVCFSTSVQSEITHNGRKLVGSAQRRFQQAVLQHGSILLGPAHESIVDLLFSAEQRSRALEMVRSKSISIAEISDEYPFQQVEKLQLMCEALTRGFSHEFEIQFEMADSAGVQLEETEKLQPEFRIS